MMGGTSQKPARKLTGGSLKGKTESEKGNSFIWAEKISRKNYLGVNTPKAQQRHLQREDGRSLALDSATGGRGRFESSRVKGEGT